MSNSTGHAVVNPFLQAKMRLIRRGWCKFARHSPTHQCCLIGSLEERIPGTKRYKMIKEPNEHNLVSFLADVIYHNTGYKRESPYHTVTGYNDNSDRNQIEVVKILNIAINKWDKEQKGESNE